MTRQLSIFEEYREPPSIPIEEKLIIDLCGGTGSWSEPYREAGYPVEVITKPKYDVRTYKTPLGIYGILAAPPCTGFALSGAQYWPVKDADGRTAEAVEIAKACVRIIHEGDAYFWSLENPVGRIQELVPEIGPIMLEFDPFEYAGWGDMAYLCKCGGLPFEYELGKDGCPNCCGDNVAKLIHKDAYTKRSRLWGKFHIPEKKRVPPIQFTSQGSWLQALGGASDRTKELRSITPQGFARAFFEVNQ